MATPKGTGFKWDAESERDLFGACLVVLGEPKGKTLAEAHKLLQELRGVTYTTKAATHRIQHLQKLKRKDGAAGPSSGGNGDGATPSKAAGKKRNKAAAQDDDDEGAPESATKRKRATPKKPAKPVKEEESKEDVVKTEHVEDEDLDEDHGI